MKSSRRTYLPLLIACAISGTMTNNAWAVFDTTVKSFSGLNWYLLNDYGTTQTQLSATGNPLNGGEYLTFRNTQAGTNSTTSGGAGIWLNTAGGNNTTVNVPFWELMRSSSYSLNDTTPWIRWSLRMNYDLGTSQNDLTVNGVGTMATSVASGPLAFEPGAFGGDRMSIGRQFERAYDINVKGTGAGTSDDWAYNAGAETTWNPVGSPAASADHVLIPSLGGNYPAANSDIINITMGKRPDGTLDIYWDGPDIKGTSPSHYVNTLSTDNPDWFFYQLEIRARGSNGTPQFSEQDLLLFEYGNDWGYRPDEVWGVLSEYQTASVTAVPEPGSLALLGLGSLLFVARRRKK